MFSNLRVVVVVGVGVDEAKDGPEVVGEEAVAASVWISTKTTTPVWTMTIFCRGGKISYIQCIFLPFFVLCSTCGLPSRALLCCYYLN